MKPLRNSESGFTLLEILISVFLLINISISIFTATTNTYRLRDVLMEEGDFANGIRLSMGILERDLSMVYNPELLRPVKTKKKSPETPPETQGDTAEYRTTQYWLQPTDSSLIRASHFIGSETHMSFVSLSNLRVYHDSKESEFLKVKYELRDDPKPNPDAGTKILVRISSPNAFDEDDEKDAYKKTHTLLRGITKFKLRYLKPPDTWLNDWDNEKQDMRAQYPLSVELTVEVKGGKRLNFEGQYLFKPEIPLRGLNARF